MPEPYYTDEQVQLFLGDCLDVMATIEAESVDSVCTDPPYGLEFMGEDWDRPWAVSATNAVGYAGRDALTLPAHRDNRNANCRACGGRQRGAKRCECPTPQWDRDPAADMRAYQSWCEQWATECLRILKPGGHLLAFGGTRTWHRLAAAIEDAGFEIRDSIAWIYGSGFPKSLDVSKAIDKRRDWDSLPLLQEKIRSARTALGISQSEAARRIGLIGETETLGGGGFMWFETGLRIPTRTQYAALKSVLSLDDQCDAVFEEAERESITYESRPGMAKSWTEGTGWNGKNAVGPVAVTDAAKQQWQGWGTALKPSHEPVVVARKPLSGTVAANVLAHGTGALNIDGCRVEAHDAQLAEKYASVQTAGARANSVYGKDARDRAGSAPHTAGRWPANVVLDDAAAAELDRQSGDSRSRIGVPTERAGGSATNFAMTKGGTTGYEDAGGASRFFPTFRYTAKAATAERPTADGVAHPTVKPLDLMRWLVRLVTPPGGTVLEPFAGSGTTVEACIHEHKRCIAIEREPSYLPLIRARLSKPMQVGFDFEAGA